MKFEILDIIALVILILFAMQGLYRGFTKEFMSKAGIFFGVLVALLFTSALAPVIDERFAFGQWSNIAAFIALFAGSYLIMQRVAIILRNVLGGLHLKGLDSALGFLLGALEGAIVISFIVFILKLQTVYNLDTLFNQSWVVQTLEPLAPYSIDFVKETL